MKKKLTIFYLVAITVPVLAAGIWFCDRCGHSNPDYEKVCNYCGNKR